MESGFAMRQTNADFVSAACANNQRSLASPPQWGHQEMSLGMRAQLGCLVLVHLTCIGHSERGHHLILMAIRNQSSEI